MNDQAPEGLRTSLNAIREEIVVGNKVYGQDIPVITDTTSISEFGTPLLNNPEVYNEWCDKLVKRIIYTGIKAKTFNNPFQDLEGETLPLGYMGQEIYTNPVKPRKFNVNDFAGLLRKYEADTKVMYAPINSDLQYPLTIMRDKVRNAFTSWTDLNAFVESQINAIYNGAYITRYNQVKTLIANAYRLNSVQVKVVADATASEENARNLVKQARAIALNFQSPSSDYNAWAKVGGYGNAVVTWADTADIYMIVRNDVLATIDVEVLARAFNMSETQFIGHVKGVDNFDIYNDEGQKVFDGSKIQAIMADKAWFKLHTQEFTMESDFYNSNNRSRQYYLNDVRGVNYSLFANAVVFATEAPSTPAESIAFTKQSDSVAVEGEVEVSIDVKPFSATTPVTISSTSNKVQVTQVEGARTATIKGVTAGEATIKAVAGDLQTTMTITISA